MSGGNREPSQSPARCSRGLLFAGLILLVIGGCGGADSSHDGAESDLDTAEGEAPTTIISESGVEMVLLPGGWFEMGYDGGNPDEGPVHRVWVDAFVMDRYEVTQDQYRQLQLSDASRFQGDRLPVEQRTWIDAIRFCNERSYEEGLDPCYDEETLECDFQANGYRLPTEAEWEYAARAGTTTRYFFGNDPRRLSQYAWTADNAGNSTQEVGTRRANPWGLFDLYGNVAEWVHDYYGESYYSFEPGKKPQRTRPGRVQGGPGRGLEFHGRRDPLLLSGFQCLGGRRLYGERRNRIQMRETTTPVGVGVERRPRGLLRVAGRETEAPVSPPA